MSGTFGAFGTMSTFSFSDDNGLHRRFILMTMLYV